jgi:hypothetical protein
MPFVRFPTHLRGVRAKFPRSLHQLQDKAAFEAAHSFMQAIIASVGQSDHRPLPQQAFAEEIIPYYTQLLMKVSWIVSRG